MKVLVSDKYSAKGIEVFEAAEGIEVDYLPGLSAEELLEKIDEYDGLAVRSATKATAQVISKASRLRVIGRAGIGVDNIDLKAATRAGICVMNTPGGNNITTAEHTIGMLLALSRNIPQANQSLKSFKWEKSKFLGTEVMGKTLGVIGLGNIGKVVAKLGMGLNMRVVGFDPFLSDDMAKKLGIRKVELDDLLAAADYVTVHVPKSDKTLGLINAKAIAKMKDGVRILNCARGGIVDESALADALASGKVAGAALDVFVTEPPGKHPLFEFKNVICTPHLGASTQEAQNNVAVMIAEQMIDFLKNGTIINAVNVFSLSPEQQEEMEPFTELATKLGSMLAQVSSKAPAEIHFLYGGEASDLDTTPLRAAALKGFMEQIAEVDVNSINAEFLTTERGIALQETRKSSLKGFANLIGLTGVYPDGSTMVLEGARLGLSDLRLVRYDDMATGIELAGTMLILRNHDRPGVVGEVGTLLGQSDVNIANLRLSRQEAGGEALLMISIDSPVPQKVLEQVRNMPAIVSVDQVVL